MTYDDLRDAVAHIPLWRLHYETVVMRDTRDVAADALALVAEALRGLPVYLVDTRKWSGAPVEIRQTIDLEHALALVTPPDGARWRTRNCATPYTERSIHEPP